MSKKQIEDAVKHSLESYFKDLRGSEPDNLHDMLIKIVEKPLLEVVLKHADNNQSKAIGQNEPLFFSNYSNIQSI